MNVSREHQTGAAGGSAGPEQVPAADYEQQLYSQIERRHSHRNGFLPDPPPARVLAALGAEADFARGQRWGLPPSMMAPLHRSAGVVALLATRADEPADWIRSGQALQRVLLAANVNGVATALHSQPLELPELREFIRIRLNGGAYPQMPLRFGATDKVTTSTRRPAEEVLL